MTSIVYTKAKTKLAKAELNLHTDDIRVLLVMTNTTTDTEEDKEFMDDFTTLDEYGGANYVRKALVESVGEDLTNNRAEMDATDVTWTALGAGARQAQGVVIYKHVSAESDSIPIAYIDGGDFPFSGNGGDVTIVWNAEGIIQVT